MTLRQMQRAAQRAILSGVAPPGLFRSAGGVDAATRFSAYADAYRLRLAAFLAHDYPALRETMGDEAFGALVEAYVDGAPSTTRNARWYGARLPETLAGDARWADRRDLIDLARFERALADAFDAADAETVEAAALARLGPDDWPALKLALHPSAVCEDYFDGVEERHAAALDGAPGPAPACAAVSPLLIWRAGDEVRTRRVDEPERMALALARDGAVFADLCAALAFQLGPADAAARAARLLVDWVSARLLAAPGANMSTRSTHPYKA